MQLSLSRTFFVPLAVFAMASALGGCRPPEYTTAPVPAKNRSAATSNSVPSTEVTPAAGPSTGPAAGTPTPAQTPATGKISFDPKVPYQDELSKCMNLWGTVPFTVVKPAQVKVMDVSVGIGGGLLGSSNPLSGLGSLFNLGNSRDLEVTPEPRLIIVPLSVNLGGNVTFELMNPNGWYCMKAAVGAKSTLNIKLHCNARLAQSDLGISLETKPAAGAPLPVKVGINDGTTPGGQLGIMVDSSVNLTRAGTGGAACPP
jgi:hypothetical protein